ncbi:MAG: hypothetical protein KDA65_18580, partial [Planctomycetaceae bacterium]|nr:hypothetical protein [Planctomycetaceae bacterium]
TYCSYADLIMPHFLFFVGFAFRLTFGRRDYKDGPTKAYARVVRRILGLMLVAFSVYHVGRRAETWDELTQMTFWEIFEEPMKNEWLQTLGHIAVTSLWILPWLRTSIRTRILFMIASGLAHLIACHYGYFRWVNTSPNGVDGGPLGFLTWTIPAILGTIACDWVVDAREASPQRHAPLKKMFIWSMIIMLIGWMITWPARVYDISPGAMTALKENEYRHRDRINAAIGEMNKPLNEKLKPFNELVSKLAGKVTELDFKAKQEIVTRLMTENGLDPKSSYPSQSMNAAAVEEWETKYVIGHEEELGAMHQRLDYYQHAIAPEKIYPSGSEEQLKIQIARLHERILTEEIAHKKKIRAAVMTSAELNPETDEPTEEIQKQIDEQFAKEQDDIAADLRTELQGLRAEYMEKLSPYSADLEEARSRLEQIGENEANEKSEQQMLVENLEARQEIDWNSLPAYGWRDLKLAEHPVAFNLSEWTALPLSQKVGRNPFAKPPYEDSKVVDYQPRDAFYWNAWMMSQRAGTVAYPTFAGGASLLMYLLFYIACDMWRWQVPLFRTWGTNALAAYVLFGLVCGGVKQFVPKDPVWWYGWGSWALGMFLMWVVIRNFEKNKIFIRM